MLVKCQNSRVEVKMTGAVVAALLGLATLSFTSAMSAGAMVSVLDLSEQEQDIAAVFNKVAYGGTTTTKRSVNPNNAPPLPAAAAVPTAVSPLTTVSIPSTTTESNLSPAPTSPSNQDLPPYAPPSRVFITPPLPPEYVDQFADKPTLRGSNSDGPSTVARRPLPPPPPPYRAPPEEERIPIRPPDLAVTHSKKKALNTPSFNRVAQVAYAELATSTESTSPRSNNETDFDFVPIIHYSSVSRILSGSSGRRHDFPDIGSPSSPIRPNRPRQEEVNKAPRTVQESSQPFLKLDAVRQETTESSSREPTQTSFRPEVKTTTITPSTERATTIRTTSTTSTTTIPPPVEETSKRAHSRVTEPSEEHTPAAPPHPPQQTHIQEHSESVVHHSFLDTTQHMRPNARQVLGAAWDVHVYMIAVAFAILTVYCLFALLRLNVGKRLLPKGYFLSLHGLLATIGILRCGFLSYDAYNSGHSFPEPISHLLLNIVFPLLATAFALVFLFLMRACEVHIGTGRFQSPGMLTAAVALYLVLCVTLDLSTGLAPNSTLLTVACQCLFIVVCLGLGLSYMYVYKLLSSAAARKPGLAPLLQRTSLAHAVRSMLATALLAVLMAAVQLYGMLGVYEAPGDDQPHPWLWWGFQFSVRVIEIAMCALLCWAGTQPPSHCNPHEDDKETQSQNSSSTAFALFSCGGDAAHANRNDPVDDIYPAVCANQGGYHYSIRSAGKIYDNAYPLNNIQPISPQEAALGYGPERHSLKKYPPRGGLPNDSPSVMIKSANDALLSYPSVRRGPPPPMHRAQPSPSMLVAEDGFVRFRSLADSEHAGPPEMVHRASLSRKAPPVHPSQQDYAS
ncbi:proline-rich transmembrane protein 3 [Thrips palmi]|uniref:Proline-rich transmembrane protein 3 n=1 Tax=Thrips palmi TaxID=161013 RepID=A0A6P9AC95_THRPL|nr:proline-rich transmembrane protein 3 [Thrips palmi]XP_034255757.1 proline-rich transmembrane protein 3 [Thrips palmi]